MAYRCRQCNREFTGSLYYCVRCGSAFCRDDVEAHGCVLSMRRPPQHVADPPILPPLVLPILRTMPFGGTKTRRKRFCFPGDVDRPFPPSETIFDNRPNTTATATDTNAEPMGATPLAPANDSFNWEEFMRSCNTHSSSSSSSSTRAPPILGLEYENRAATNTMGREYWTERRAQLLNQLQESWCSSWLTQTRSKCHGCNHGPWVHAWPGLLLC